MNVADFVGSCKTYQIHSNISHQERLHPTYSFAIHFKWVVDLVVILEGLAQKKYILLAWEDLSNQVKSQALYRKTTKGVCWFSCRGCYLRLWLCWKIIAHKGKLDAKEIKEFFLVEWILNLATCIEDGVQSRRQWQEWRWPFTTCQSFSKSL